MLYLSRVQLRNVRCFETIDIEFGREDRMAAWTVLVGDNATGNAHTYEYAIYGVDSPQARLKTVYVNGTRAGNAEALVVFTWILDASVAGSANVGRVSDIKVLRRGGGGSIVRTQQVHYRYMGEPGLHANLGTDGDLIEVIQMERMDSAPGALPSTLDWAERITQYRYHCDTCTGSIGPVGDPDFTWAGSDLSLIHISEPTRP